MVVSDAHVNKRNLVPSATTVVDKDRIDALQVHSLKELSAVIPNFFMPDYAARTTAPVYIRGVGMKSDGTAVAFYVDGVPYYEPITFETDMSDISRVEVMRGPQGTLFGRNAIGGTINIRTLSPFAYRGTVLKAGAASRGDVRLQGSNYSLLSQRVGLALGATCHHADGVFRNHFNGRRTDRMDESEEHARFYWQISRRWRLRLTSRLAYSDQGGYSYAPYDTQADTLAPICYNRPSGFRRLVLTNGLNLAYEGKGYALQSQTSFQYLKSHQWVDQDYTAQDKTYLLSDRHQHLLTQEFTAKSDNQGRYQWIAGAFLMYQHVDRRVDNEHPSASSLSRSRYHQPTSSLALYHQSSLNMWRGLSLSGGLRFDYEHTRSRYSRLTYSGRTGQAKPAADFNRAEDFRQLTPKFSLQYLTTRANKYYFALTRGYKPGGFNRSIAQADRQRYDPEYSWNWEAGTELSLIGKRLTVGADLFYIDWRRMQLTYTYVGIGTLTTNAGHADSRGAELWLSLNPIKDLRLDAAYGYTYARFVSYRKAEGTDYSHNRLPMVPTNTLFLSANYHRERLGPIDRLVVNLSVQALGPIRWAEDNRVKQDFYALLNASVAIQRKFLTLELWGKNLSSTRYLSNVMTVSTGTYAQKGRPFAAGISLKAEL